MTTLVFVENVLGSGHTVKLIEDFGDYSVSRILRPGEHVRLVVSEAKSVSIEEAPADELASHKSANEDPRIKAAPPSLARRRG